MAGRLAGRHFVAHFVARFVERLKGTRPDKVHDKVEDKVEDKVGPTHDENCWVLNRFLELGGESEGIGAELAHQVNDVVVGVAGDGAGD